MPCSLGHMQAFAWIRSHDCQKWSERSVLSAFVSEQFPARLFASPYLFPPVSVAPRTLVYSMATIRCYYYLCWGSDGPGLAVGAPASWPLCLLPLSTFLPLAHGGPGPRPSPAQDSAIWLRTHVLLFCLVCLFCVCVSRNNRTLGLVSRCHLLRPFSG